MQQLVGTTDDAQHELDAMMEVFKNGFWENWKQTNGAVDSV
jgi:hypothetical protein